MDVATLIFSAIIAVTVPWFTFRLALRQDHVRWIREQRSQLYVDMLTEAGAEQDWLEYRLADEVARERAREWYTNKRLPLPGL
jgi:hypothetical protein